MEYIRGTQTRFGQSGNIGGIPPEYVAERYAVTQLIEPENMMYDYFRDTLKDNTCEPPSFESDLPRYDHGAKNLLNVMYQGRRADIEPSHPEIYIANTVGDIRGGTEGKPRMIEMRKHTEDRMRFKDLRSTATSDQGVDSGVWSPHAINQAMRGTWAGLKRREKWFARSLSAGASGVGVKTDTRGSRLDYIKMDDEKHHDLVDITTQVFTPSEVVFGNAWKPVIVGARNVPTHEFHVAKYGDAPRAARYKYDASKNQFKAEATADFQKSEELTLRGLAKVMASEAGCAAANPTTAFDESAEGMADRRVGKHGNARETLNTMMHSQMIVESLVAETESKRGRANQEADMKNRRLHKLIDPEIYGEIIESKHLSIKLIDDPFAIANRRRNAQMIEVDGDGSAESVSYANAPRADAEAIRRARNSSLMEYDSEESMRASRGKTNLHKRDYQKNVVSEQRDIDETLLGTSTFAERHTGPIGIKSELRRHARADGNRDSLGDSIGAPSFGVSRMTNGANRPSRNGSISAGGINMDVGEPDNEPMHMDMMSSRI